MRFFISMLVILVTTHSASYAAPGEDAPLNFDTQIIRIFEAAQTAPDYLPGHGASDENHKALTRILDKFRKHKMMLKNAVYRTDMDVIRITWADDDNIDIVKAAYKTAKDPILGNSVYADKRQVISLKIMYRTKAGAYEYIHLQNMDNIAVGRAEKPPPLPEQPTFNYSIEGKLTNEQCRFCHTLAQNDGSPKGVFFPRYQEFYGQHHMGEMNAHFHADHFEKKPAASARELGLPDMREDFLYQKVMPAESGGEPTRFTRMLIELPQLIEVMARDNKQSICVVSAFPYPSTDNSEANYVCADNVAQRLMVKLTNPMLVSGNRSKEYSEPYFAKY
jgi:hypothetical protein